MTAASVQTTDIDDDLLEETAYFFKVLGDPTRLRIVYALFEGELCVNDISSHIDLSVSAVSHQLAMLKRAKLVASRRDGKMIYYRLDDDHIRTILGVAHEHSAEGEIEKPPSLLGEP